MTGGPLAREGVSRPLPEPARDSAGRRLFDIVVALAGLAVLLPVLPAVALAIVVDTPGPVLFSQLRLGRHGRPFRLYKFRKFRDGAAGLAVTLKDDGRMTRIGRILERTKMDEIPQLWNVLRGDMSIVGPRPETLAFADCFRGDYRGLLDHRPGIFGPNQILFRNESALFPERCDADAFYRTVLFPAKARIDLDYFPRRTLIRDTGWLVGGVLAVVDWGPRADHALLGHLAGGPAPAGMHAARARAIGRYPPAHAGTKDAALEKKKA